MALRCGRFSSAAYDTLAEGTVRNAITYVAAAFRENDMPNPTKDEDGVLGRILQQQFRAFKNEDPNPIQQKAIPICVLEEMAKLVATETQRTISQLSIGGFFFACRSCEYLKVPEAEKRRTEILRLRDIRFFKNGRELNHGDPQLEYADCVSLTFEVQKNDERMDVVTQLSTGEGLLCPVKAWAAVVRRIWQYAGATIDTPVSAVWRNGKIEHIQSKEMSAALSAAVVSIGEETLGIKKNEVGTHSIRSGAAMAMYLGECPVYTIMMIGRWQSDAFLCYIRNEVEQFSHIMSSCMLHHKFLRHTPNAQPNNSETMTNIGGEASRRMSAPPKPLFG